MLGQKEVDWEENVSTVRAPDDYACEDEYDERFTLPPIDEEEESVWVMVRRIFLLLSPGHGALVFRVKPRSLERQWMMVEAQKTGVTFRTINK